MTIHDPEDDYYDYDYGFGTSELILIVPFIQLQTSWKSCISDSEEFKDMKERNEDTEALYEVNIRAENLKKKRTEISLCTL